MLSPQFTGVVITRRSGQSGERDAWVARLVSDHHPHIGADEIRFVLKQENGSSGGRSLGISLRSPRVLRQLTVPYRRGTLKAVDFPVVLKSVLEEGQYTFGTAFRGYTLLGRMGAMSEGMSRLSLSEIAPVLESLKASVLSALREVLQGRGKVWEEQEVHRQKRRIGLRNRWIVTYQGATLVTAAHPSVPFRDHRIFN